MNLIPSIYVLFSSFLFSDSISADNNMYHYVLATLEDVKQKKAFISKTSLTTFDQDYDFAINKDYIESEMKRQFLNFLAKKYNSQLNFNYKNCEYGSNNFKIEEKWEETKKEYKEKGFKVIVVKGFVYD